MNTILTLTLTLRAPSPFLHEKHKLDNGRGPQQLAEGVDEEVEGEQAQLDQQDQRVVVGLQHLRAESRASGRCAAPRRIQGGAHSHTYYTETYTH